VRAELINCGVGFIDYIAQKLFLNAADVSSLFPPSYFQESGNVFGQLV